jgi:two-component system CheB/CheR fusion protein
VDFEVRGDFPVLGERIMLLNASPIIRDHSEEQSILISIEDVTEKRRKDKEEKELAEELERKVFERTMSLNQANIELQHSNENLAQFAYIASHDLQEPLRKIRTFSSILQDKHTGELPYPVRGLVAKISASSERMSTLISDVLNFSKAVNSDGAFKQTDLALTKVISDFDLLIAEKKVVIHREPLPVIDAIPFQINQLFYNLISNAIKFSKNGLSPVITITSKLLGLAEMAKWPNLNPKFSYCEIGIKDNGIGFNQDMKDKIFLIFQRLHTQQEYLGTGIGLALCKKIVANHHGEIAATSRRDEGATFKILLPLERH